MKSKHHSFKTLFSTVAVLVIGGIAGDNALAADGTWISATANSTWSVSGSWQDGVIPGATTGNTNTDIATFNVAVSGGSGNRVVNVDADRNIGGITFGDNNINRGYALNGGPLVLSAGGVIQLDSTATGGSHFSIVNAIVTLAGDATFSNNAESTNRKLRFQVVNGSATEGNVSTLTIGGSNTASLNQMVSPIGDGANGGKLALTMSGAGTWTLTPTSISTYTGATTVSAGTLLVNGSLGNTAVSVGANGTIGGSGSLGGSLAFDGDATLNVVNLADALTIVGSVTFGSGFGIDNLTGIDWDALDLNTGYTLLNNGTDFSAAGLDNFGLANAVSVGALGRQAYFETGNLQVVLIPEPNVAALLGGLGILALLRRRRDN